MNNINNIKAELLAPAGNMNKLKTAFHFGADAVYLGGKNFGLRAYAGNFDNDQLKTAVDIAHSQGKRIYITCNIFAKNNDFGLLKEYIKYLESIDIDAVIMTDIGAISMVKNISPKLDIHISTQANTTNKYAVKAWQDFGASRVVLARELSLCEIKEIKNYVGDGIELETFVHGAMCISYSGRCLLSNYLSKRDGNRGECVQACRWEYKFHEVKRPNSPLTMAEDERGTYIMNSKDMMTLPFIDQIIDAGVTSLKIEGRMKSEYYIGSVVNSYRRGINAVLNGEKVPTRLIEDLYKINHRDYTEGFYNEKEAEICLETSTPYNEFDFVAEVLGYCHQSKSIIVEQRNRFYVGDALEILSSEAYDGEEIKILSVNDEDGNVISDCKFVQQKLYIKSEIVLKKQDILRKKKQNNS